MRPRTIRAILVMAAVLLGVPALGAAAPPPLSVTAWSGGMAPFDTLHGVRLLPAGGGQVLEVTPANRASGKVTVVGAFTPTAAQRAAIRAAASGLPADGLTAGGIPADGFYGLAVAEIGSSRRSLLAVNRLDPRLEALFAALDAALPPARRLKQKPVSSRVGALQAEGECAETPATEISRPKNLREAVQQGLARLTAKGGYQGDTVAIDLTAKPTTGPVRITVRMEFVDAAPFDPASLALIEQKAEGFIGPLKASNGTPVTVDFDIRTRRPGDPVTPCYHQITMHDEVGYRSSVDALGVPNDGVVTGNFGSADPRILNGSLIAHEGMHLAGLDDQYRDYFFVPGKAPVPVPDTIGANDKAGLESWARSVGLNPARGVLRSVPKPGHAKDLMGNVAPGSRVLRRDIDALVRQAGVRVTAEPGDLLGNKAGDQQNLGVARRTSLFAPRGGTAHADGIWGYCIDSSKHAPSRGGVLDVFAPAREQPGPNMAALQAVLEVIARRPLDGGSIVPGAQYAIWAVTDNEGAGLSSESLAILAEAGVPGGLAGTPHLTNPNAASPESGVVDPSGAVLPPVPPAPEEPLVPLISGARVSPEVLAARRPRRVDLDLSVGVTGGRLTILVQRRTRGRFRTVGRLPARTVDVGQRILKLRFPGLAVGSYRLRVSVGAERVDVPFAVRRSRP